MTNLFKGTEVRNSTQSSFVIFFEGKELKTTKQGSVSSDSGLVLFANLPTGEPIKWRSNDVRGKKGFSFDKLNPIYAKDDASVNKMEDKLISKLEYKL